MYACAMIIYGWDLSGKDSKPIKFKNADKEIVTHDVHKFVERLDDFEPKGFHNPYDGGGGEPYAFGVEVGGINGFGNMLLSDFPQSVTTKQEKRLSDMVNALNDEDKAFIKKLGEPQLFLLWHTS